MVVILILFPKWIRNYHSCAFVIHPMDRLTKKLSKLLFWVILLRPVYLCQQCLWTHLTFPIFTRWIMKPRPTRDRTWEQMIWLDTWWCSKNIDSAKFMRVGFTIDSERRRLNVGKYKHKFSIDLECFETRRHVNVFN